jgi:hypothetical protein
MEELLSQHQGLHPDSWVLGCEKKQDMVLLHHELEVVYDDGHICEQQTATLLELGETHDRDTELLLGPQSAMARTVGLPVAIGAQVIQDLLRLILNPIKPQIQLSVIRVNL